MGRDEHEFIARVTESQGIVHKICRLYCSEEEERKDLFQEILIQLWQSYPTYRGDAKFSSWMYRVGLNTALQHLRTKKRKPQEIRIEENFLNVPESEKEAEVESDKGLRKAIEGLNDIEKAIIVLYLEEHSNEEIAQIVGITQNYVRVKMNRIKIKLKKALRPLKDGA